MSIRIRQRKNGVSYLLTASTGYHINKHGKYEQKRFFITYRAPEGLSEAKAYRLALEKEIEFKRKIDIYKYNPDIVLFKELWNRYYEYYAIKKLKVSTLYNLEMIVKAHVLPFFEDKRLKTITTLTISEFLHDLSLKRYANKKYSNLYIKSVRSKLHAIFEYGVTIGWLVKNPCKGAHIARSDFQDQKKFYSLKEIKEIHSYIKTDSILDDILLFQLYTGLRIGETLALAWNDINTMNSYIDINKTVSLFKGEFIQSTPKTRYSYRHIYMTPSIQEIINKQNKDYDLVFSINNGQYINKGRVRRQLLNTLKGTKYESLTVHDLRHVHASLLLNNNIDLKTISAHLGHSSIKITADIYIKTFAENHAKLAYDLYDFFNDI